MEILGTYGATMPGFMMTILSCHQSTEIVVNGPTAKPGMKFVMLRFSFGNDGIRAHETPYINAGEVKTDKR